MAHSHEKSGKLHKMIQKSLMRMDLPRYLCIMVRKTSFTLSEETMELLENLAKQEGQNKSQMIQTALRFFQQNTTHNRMAKMEEKLDTIIALLARQGVRDPV